MVINKLPIYSRSDCAAILANVWSERISPTNCLVILGNTRESDIEQVMKMPAPHRVGF